VTGVRALLLTVLSFVVAVSVACGDHQDESSGSSRLVELSSTQPVAEAFNADKGHARLILLLSPT
jgi:hypothetical protein